MQSIETIPQSLNVHVSVKNKVVLTVHVYDNDHQY